MIRDIALLGARLAVGGAMAAHGAQKAFGWFGGPGPEKAAGLMHELGFRPAATYALLASWNEIVSGALVGIGLGGPLGPSLMLSNMIVAQASADPKKGFFAQQGGFEPAFVYSAAALAFATSDFGAISVDAIIGTRKPLRDPVLLTLALAGGITGALVVLNRRDQSPEGPATPTFRGKNSPLPEPEPAAASER